MKRKTLILFSATVAILGFVSCKKEATSSENASSFMYQLQTTNRTSVVGRIATTDRIAGANIQWTSGTAAVNELKFEAEGNSGEVEFKQKTAQQIDLFSASASLGNITIPAGTYNEVEFKAILSPNGNAPALELNGSFTSGTVTKAVKFLVSSTVELKAEKQNVTVAQGSTYSALNTLDLSQLTNGLSEAALNNAAVSGGTIVLSSSSNTDLYNIVLRNLSNHHGEAEIEHHR
jgi:hypothetical protein